MGGCGECVEFGVNTGHCVLPPGGWRGLVHIPAVRSRMPNAGGFGIPSSEAFCLPSHILPSHQFDQGQEENNAKKTKTQNTKHPEGSV